ncbi:MULTISPECIES: DUF3986 family protein [Neobacillus]|jgi:hypothetical protein|uniref:DUF3986 family protein n=1 Tax=Neobacillus TaxID=2675232 RepID=UPI0004F8C6F3|nr:DUF3986 family protein [Neobacillus sedimentimangrovi]AIM16747.1 hypothetical protein HW35_11205 [Bacillus sp. X1(2014)]
MVKYEDFHLHVGYYNDSHDLEGIFYKEKNKPKWYLYFDADGYDIQLKKEYKKEENFGYLVGIYDIEEIDQTQGDEFFKNFLMEESIIK